MWRQLMEFTSTICVASCKGIVSIQYFSNDIKLGIMNASECARSRNNSYVQYGYLNKLIERALALNIVVLKLCKMCRVKEFLKQFYYHAIPWRKLTYFEWRVGNSITLLKT